MKLDVVEGLELVFVRRLVGAEAVVFKGRETQFWGSAKAESGAGHDVCWEDGRGF